MKFTSKPLVLLFMLAFLSSCVDNLDFDQVDLDIDPIFTSPLVFLELDQNDFFDADNSVEITTVADISDFTTLQSSVVQDNLTQAVFNIEAENRFDRSFLIEVDLLDDDNNVTYSFADYLITANDLNYTATTRIFPQSTPDFLNSTRMNIVVTILPSSNQLDPNIPKTLKFKSAGIYYLSF